MIIFYSMKIFKKRNRISNIAMISYIYLTNEIRERDMKLETRWGWSTWGKTWNGDWTILFRWFRYRCRRVMHRITFVSRARIIDRPFTCHTGRKSKRAVVKSFVEEDTLIFMIEIVRACRSYVHDYFLPRSNEFRF